jgi:cystathionine beta-lyase
VEHPDLDLSDDELRAAGSVKWTWYPADVLPAWVAEIDVRPCPPIARALHEAVDRGSLGYPAPDTSTGVPEATAAVLQERLGWTVAPEDVVLAGDVMAGVRIVLDALCEQAPVVVPVPTYPPFLDVVPVTGRDVVPVALDDAGVLDPGALDDAFAAGARTLLLSAPHNPTGRVWSREELEAVRDVVVRHGARVVSDEIHAFLCLPGAQHIPYATLEGTADHVTTVVSASKAWNVPGLKCAQIVAGNPADRAALRAVPHVANHGVSSLGLAATLAAYRDGGPWLDKLVRHLDRQCDLFDELMAKHLPGVATWRRPEATYLAWVDARGTGLADPAAVALRESRVAVGAGVQYGPRESDAYRSFVRVTLATSAERLERIVAGLARAWT